MFVPVSGHQPYKKGLSPHADSSAEETAFTVIDGEVFLPHLVQYRGFFSAYIPQQGHSLPSKRCPGLFDPACSSPAPASVRDDLSRLRSRRMILALYQLTIVAFCLHESFMRALLSHLPIHQHDDAVRMAYRIQSVRDHDTGSILHQPV